MSNDKTTIRIFQTHIEIYPYRMHQSPELELRLSKKDKPTHSLIPIGYYWDEGHEKLYLPRGVNILYLEDLFHTKSIMDRCSIAYEPLKHGEVSGSPRNQLQCNAIDFLMQVGDYQNTSNYTQLGLNLPPSSGKTYCMIHALVTMRQRAVIICHSKKIRDQWISSFSKHTTVPEERVLVINNMKIIQALRNGETNPLEYDYFILLHQTLTYYATTTDWYEVRDLIQSLQVYAKVIDEAHLYFENSLMIDYFTNLPITYYLTATFGRSDPQENFIYKMVYSRCFRFGNEVRLPPHTILFVLLIRTDPTSLERKTVEHATSYGFSAANYMKYELEEHDEMMNAILYALEKTKHLKGIRLVTSGLIKTVDGIRDRVKEEYPDWNCISVHTKTGSVDSDDLEMSDMISATTKYIGTGSDIHGLRVLISTESMGSKINIEQLIGRLRPYYDDDGNQLDTVMYYIVDTAFRSCVERYQKVIPTLRKMSKKVCVLQL